MRAKIIGYLAATSVAALLPSLALAQENTSGTQDGQSQEAASAEPLLEGNEIVVTASKRAERLQDVPASVTALDGETLQRVGAQSFRDYVSLVPGLSQRDGGNPGTGTVILRGLNTGPQSITNTSATYLDEMPFTASGFLSAGAIVTPDPDVADVQRIEVLKGPQGTLYGANSLGGLIRIISSRADVNAFSGSARAEATTIDGGDEGYSLRASVNAPIVPGMLAIRANGVYRRAPGWTDNVGTGTENVNDSVIKGGRLAVRFMPTEDLTIDLTGFYQDIENDGVALQDNVYRTLTPRSGRYKYRQVQDFPSSIKYRIGSATAEYDFGPVALIGTASYGRYKTRILNDATENYIGFVRAAVPALRAIIPADAQGVTDFSPNMKKFTSEVRLVSERIGPIEFLLGGFYTNEKSRYRTNILVNNAAGQPLTAPFDVLVRALTSSDYEELAGFGNVTLYLGDHFDVTGGLRYAHNEQWAQTGGPNAVSFYAPRAIANFEFEDNVTTYLATARWRPTRNVTAYVRASSGYRPGGPQNNPSPPPTAQLRIRPDTTWNYEAGVKATLLDGALTANAAIYRIDWEDIQLNTVFGGITLQANGGDARVEGIELELAARPTELLSIAASVGHTKGQLERVDPGVQTSVGARAGDPLPLTPDWTVALLADQVVPLSEGVNASFGGTLRFRSDMPSSYPNALLNPNIKIPSLTTLDLRAGVDFGRFGVQLRAENITDAFGYTTVSTGSLFAGQQVPTQGTVIRPRSFTLALTTNF